MLVLPNVLISTSRSALNAAGGTNPAMPYLAGVQAHGRPITPNDYRLVGEIALESDFVFSVEAGTDIVAEDIITSCVLIDDGVTTWSQSASNPNEALRVALAEDWTPGPLTYRNVYVKKITGGGVAY